MTKKRIQELREMLDRGTIQKRHINEMLSELEANNLLLAAANKIAAATGR